MADFDQLAPEIRCVELVGQFLQAWSVMEGSLHKALGSALVIEDIKSQILCVNIELSKKYILRTLIGVSPDIQENTNKTFRSSLKKLRISHNFETFYRTGKTCLAPCEEARRQCF